MPHSEVILRRSSSGSRHVGLDALRGIAALSVLLHHINGAFDAAALDARMPLGLFVNGYHAVDFFFMLSGFVIGSAYEGRMRAGLTFRDYAAIRIGRLYPTLFVGTLVALLLLPVQALEQDIALSVVSQLSLVPFLAGAALMYPLNIVQWSIFFELVVNAAHHLLLRHLGDRSLLVICAVAGAFLAAVCWVGGSISGGWWLDSTPVGLARAVFGFSAGLLIYRKRAALKVPAVPLAAVASVLLMVLASQPVRGLSQVQDAIVVLLILPAILVFAVRASVSHPRLATLAGGLSFPLYSVHLPILYATAALAAGRDPAIAWTCMLAGIGVALALSALMWRWMPATLATSRQALA